MKIAYIGAVVVSTLASVEAFSRPLPRHNRRGDVPAATPLSFAKTAPSAASPTALRYRPLDQRDAKQDEGADETTASAMLKIQTRAPPGFDMKSALAETDGAVDVQKMPKTGMNTALIRALLLNQGFILSVAVCGFAAALVSTSGFDALNNLDAVVSWSGLENQMNGAVIDFGSWNSLAWGGIGAVPLLALSNRIENSDRREFANINFSTIVMAMTLFGRRRQKQPVDETMAMIPTTTPLDVGIQSAIISTVTGICEETVFRSLVPSILMIKTGGNLAVTVFGQAFLFALGHLQVGGASSTTLAENGIVAGLQLANGLGFGLLYLASGGDLYTCIVAHAIYDFVTFFKTWMDANSQLDYAERMSQQPLDPEVERQVRGLLRSSPQLSQRRVGPDKKTSTTMFDAIKRLFYLFDFDKNQTLSLSEVRKGIAYMALERAGTPPPQKQIDFLFDEVVRERREAGAVGRQQRDRLRLLDFILLYSRMANLRRGDRRAVSA